MPKRGADAGNTNKTRIVLIIFKVIEASDSQFRIVNYQRIAVRTKQQSETFKMDKETFLQYHKLDWKVMTFGIL